MSLAADGGRVRASVSADKDEAKILSASRPVK
jgi:hypothetical protein